MIANLAGGSSGSVRVSWTVGAIAVLSLGACSTGRVLPQTRLAVARGPSSAVRPEDEPPRYEPPLDHVSAEPRVDLLASTVAAADNDVCVIARGSGDVWCWGFAMHPAAGPVRIVGVHHAIALDVTMYSGCAATRDGQVWCWGGGLRGDGQARRSVAGVAPEVATRATIEHAIDVDVGHGQTCAVTQDGHVACWGCLWPRGWQDNECPHRAPSPEQVPGIDDAVEVAVGGAIACARRRDGRVACWGGSLGPAAQDVRIPLSTTMTGEFDEVCGVSRWGDVWCFDARDGYRVIPELHGATQVTIGGSSRCGARGDGSVICQDDFSSSRVAISGVLTLQDVTYVAHNREETCITRRDGRVACVGDDRMGGVGDPSADRRYAPRTIAGLENVVQIAAAGEGGCTTCARARDGRVACWGSDPGLLGVTDHLPRSRPTTLGIAPAVDVAVGQSMACAVHADGTLTCWADDDDGVQPPAVVSLLRRVRDVAASGDACAVLESGAVWCFSSYEQGRTPRRVDLRPMQTIDTSRLNQFIGHARDGTVWAWGTDLINGAVDAPEHLRALRTLTTTSMDFCEIDLDGDLHCTDQFEGVVRLLGHHVSAVAAGQSHGCMLLADGAVDCWGEMNGEIGGPEDRLALRRVPLDEPATDVVCGDSHTCALLASGHVACWGERGEGVLGDGTVSVHRDPLTITIPSAVSSTP